MPHIEVSMYPGRDDKIKKALAEKIKETVVDQLGCPQTVVSVSINDIPKEDFKPEMDSKIDPKDIFIESDIMKK